MNSHYQHHEHSYPSTRILSGHDMRRKEGMRETWGRIPGDAWRISPITIRENKKGVVFLAYITKNEYICTRLTIYRQQVLYTYRMNVILCMSYETAFRGQTHGETFAQY